MLKTHYDIGARFGRLVLAEIFTDGRKIRWRCRCDCGRLVTCVPNNLTGGNAKSCGCLKKDATAARNRRLATHGHSRTGQLTPTFKVWSSMHGRCKYSCVNAYKDYGGRGIRVCDRWSGPNGFASFLADMGERPTGMQIDRIDCNGDYEPGNCRWETPKVQARNKTNTVRITFRGETMPAVDWAERLGLNVAALMARHRAGWPVEKMLTVPVSRSNVHIRQKPEFYT
jgi:hypothetical protein